jgi:hypothetical protein
MPERQGDQIIESTTEARAGVSGHGLRWMLLIGTAAVVILFAFLWLHYFA